MFAYFTFSMLKYTELPYLWFFYRCLAEAKEHGWPMIAQEGYLRRPGELAAKGFHEAYNQKFVNDRQLGYRVPKNRDLKRIDAYPIPEELEERLVEECGSYTDAFCYVLTKRYKPLEDLLDRYFEEIKRKHKEPLEGIMTLCDYPSLTAAAEKHAIPVIHVEQGTFREPTYVKTAFFDLDNLYGGKTVEKRWKAFCQEHEKNPMPILTKKEMLALFLEKDQYSLLNKYDVNPKYEAGAALGYAFWELFNAKTMLNDNEILYRLSKRFGKANILVRKHPADPYGAQYPLFNAQMHDYRKFSTIDFVLECKQIATMGSNVAMEAMYWGRKAWVLVDCPSRFASGHSIEEEAVCATDDYLTFFALCYLTPYQLCFDPEYIRWRLTQPSERDVLARNLQFYLDNKEMSLDEIRTVAATYTTGDRK